MLTGDSKAGQRWGWAGSGWRSSENRRIVSFALYYRNILGIYWEMFTARSYYTWTSTF